MAMPPMITVGRASDNHFILSDPGVGRYHAELHFEPNGLMTILDLNSKNGTYINGRRIASNIRISVHETDKIAFAKAPLDWSKVLNNRSTILIPDNATPGFEERPVLEQEENFGSFLSVILGTGDRFRSIKLFFALLENTSEKIVTLSFNPKKFKVEPLEFFSIGLGLYLVIATYFLEILESVLDKEDRVNYLLPEWVLTLVVAIVLFLAALLNYNLFRLMTDSKKRWVKYFFAYLIFMGFSFIGFSLITFPLVIISCLDQKLFHPQNRFIAVLVLSIYIFYLLIWLPLIWIKMNKKFWETTYFRVVFISIAILGISTLIYRFVVSYLEAG